eukprot:COSAG06_NODE_1812_length_8310_cov_12.407259_5_plen_53_part_00
MARFLERLHKGEEGFSRTGKTQSEKASGLAHSVDYRYYIFYINPAVFCTYYR